MMALKFAIERNRNTSFTFLGHVFATLSFGAIASRYMAAFLQPVAEGLWQFES
jgi:hypothetical protein